MANAIKCVLPRKMAFNNTLNLLRQYSSTPPAYLFPIKDYRYRKPRREVEQYFEEAPIPRQTFDEIQKGCQISSFFCYS